MTKTQASYSESTLTDLFLDFLAEDIKHNPQNIKAISSDLVNRVQSLVSEVNLDLNAPLSEEDD